MVMSYSEIAVRKRVSSREWQPIEVVKEEPELIRRRTELEFEKMVQLGRTLIITGLAIAVAGIVGLAILAVFSPK
jgi:hypothetical protein